MHLILSIKNICSIVLHLSHIPYPLALITLIGSMCGKMKTNQARNKRMILRAARKVTTDVSNKNTEIGPVRKRKNTHPVEPISSDHTVNTVNFPNDSSIGCPDNIDRLDHDDPDPFFATEYAEDMFEYFRLKEKLTSVRPDYMENQGQINETMREILINWLVEVHKKFKYVPETLYLCVNLIDRVLKNKEVKRRNFQLLGVTCLFIASKYEEICHQGVCELAYICNSAYTEKEILDMEKHILKALNYQITVPSANSFLARFLEAARADEEIVQLSCHVLHETLRSYALLRYLPSELAAASIYLARGRAGKKPWDPTLENYTKYCEGDVLIIAKAVVFEIKKRYNRSSEDSD
mmetsp:Transcript_31780/g.62986  ORF Transcript_31780/g.62986 Transcript_31780/m.62986 type:complete len:351 (-) Transcript_31780:120-1172(-)